MTPGRGTRTAVVLLLGVYSGVFVGVPTADAVLDPPPHPTTAGHEEVPAGTPTPDPVPGDDHPDCGLCQYLAGPVLAGDAPRVSQPDPGTTTLAAGPIERASTPPAYRFHHPRAPPVP